MKKKELVILGCVAVLLVSIVTGTLCYVVSKQTTFELIDSNVEALAASGEGTGIFGPMCSKTGNYGNYYMKRCSKCDGSFGHYDMDEVAYCRN